jgi:hypothetical protein
MIQRIKKMGFEEYSVLVCPKEGSPLYSNNSVAALNQVALEIEAEWPEFHPDDVEMAHLANTKRAEEDFWVYETSEGLIQLIMRLNPDQGHSIRFSLRFAYSNPRSVYRPFCAMVEWLMQHYRMVCHVVPDLAPEQKGVSDNIDQADQVCAILIPSMDYNRRLWHLDAGTDAEAILRPGDAVARFIFPKLVSEEKSGSVP